MDLDLLLVRLMDGIFEYPNIAILDPNKTLAVEDEGPLPSKYMLTAQAAINRRVDPYPPAAGADGLSSGLCVCHPSLGIFGFYMRLMSIPHCIRTDSQDQDLMHYAHRIIGPLPWTNICCTWTTTWPSMREYSKGARSLHEKRCGDLKGDLKDMNPFLKKMWEMWEKVKFGLKEADKGSVGQRVEDITQAWCYGDPTLSIKGNSEGMRAQTIEIEFNLAVFSQIAICSGSMMWAAKKLSVGIYTTPPYNFSTSIPSTTIKHSKNTNNMASNGEYALLCLENPLLDIQGQGDAAMLSKYGLKANDAILADESKHMPLYEDLIQNHKAVQIAGGAAQNTARGAQYILPAHSVLYIGAVGQDKSAQTLKEACQKAGLRTEYLETPDHPTGRCGVIITGHDRSMCTHLAAANEYKLEHLKKPEVWSLVQKAKVYYVGGYHLTVCPPAALALAEEAAKEDKIFALSLSAPFIPQFFKDPLAETSPYWDYVIGNETEARAWAEAQGNEEKEDVKNIARAMAELPKKNRGRKRVAVVTQGTEATVVAVQGEEGVKEFEVHAIGKEDINDTNGAGDAFAGGFLAGIVEGKTLEESVDMGHWLASLSIRELGPQYPFPKQTYQSSKA